MNENINTLVQDDENNSLASIEGQAAGDDREPVTFKGLAVEGFHMYMLKDHGVNLRGLSVYLRVKMQENNAITTRFSKQPTAQEHLVTQSARDAEVFETVEIKSQPEQVSGYIQGTEI